MSKQNGYVDPEKLFEKKPRTVDVEVPGVGKFRFKELDAVDLVAIEDAGYESEHQKAAAILQRCWVDAQGQPKVGEHQLHQLLALPLSVFSAIIEACAEVCGFASEGQAKNLPSASTAASRIS